MQPAVLLLAVSVLSAVVSSIVGAGVAWGVLKARVEDLQREIVALTTSLQAKAERGELKSLQQGLDRVVDRLDRVIERLSTTAWRPER